MPWSIQTGPFRPCLACPLGALLPPACPLPACCLPASHDSKKASLPSLRSSLRWPACYGTAISVGRQSNARGLLLRRKWSGATGVSSTSGLHWRCTTRWRRPTSASSGLSCRNSTPQGGMRRDINQVAQKRTLGMQHERNSSPILQQQVAPKQGNNALECAKQWLPPAANPAFHLARAIDGRERGKSPNTTRRDWDPSGTMCLGAASRRLARCASVILIGAWILSRT